MSITKHEKSQRVFLAIIIVSLSCIAIMVGLGLTTIDKDTSNNDADSNPTLLATPSPTGTRASIEYTHTPPAIQPIITDIPTNTPPAAPLLLSSREKENCRPNIRP